MNETNRMSKIKIKNFNLRHTLECGQIFRWKIIDGYYIAVVGSKILKLRQEKNILYFDGTDVDKKFIKNYFRLDDDYGSILRLISRDEKMREIVRENIGLRIIRQEPWECLVSYLCSSASNIPKIRMNLDLLSEKFGKEIVFEGRKHYAFPEPGRINHLAKIRNCSVGFRAGYIFDANKSHEKIESLKMRKMDYAEARSELIEMKGVGRKIADCVLLFSLDKLEAFPTDVWIKRIMQELYFEGRNIPEKQIADFGREYFGKYAGYAQEFLYNYGRER